MKHLFFSGLCQRLTAVVFLSVGMLTCPLQASAADPIVIKFSHVTAESTPKGQAALEFKRLVEQRTRGKVKVEVYPNSSLYKDKEEMEALQLGAVQMLAPSLNKFGQLGIREFEVFGLPYIFPNRQVLRAVTEGEIGRDLLSLLENRGLTGLAYWDNGFKVMSSNSPLIKPTDLTGKRMRIQPSRVLEAQMEALGAVPIPMAFSDVYSALETGLVDGTENPPSNLYSKNMHTVQQYVTTTNHGYLGYAVIVNRKFWNSLPADLQATLNKCMQEATDKNNLAAQALNEQALEDVRKTGGTVVYDLSKEERELWQAHLEPVQRKMEPFVGKALIERIRRISRNTP